MNNDQGTPIGFIVRTRDQKGRLVYRPDIDHNNPWLSYYNGTAGKHYTSVGQARGDGFRNLETDQEREARSEHLRAIGFDIPRPLASIPETNQMSSGRLPLAKPKA
jgi:hypothetical protein